MSQLIVYAVVDIVTGERGEGREEGERRESCIGNLRSCGPTVKGDLLPPPAGKG
jgi:hypothetical protein